MTPLAALALAIRDRLVAGAPAPLPGLGTLGRAHVSARMHTGADGRRVLLPPGEAVGLSRRAFDPADLAAALARRAGAPASAAADLLREAVDQIEARLAITGDARIDGIGVFQRTSSGIRFAPAPEILAAVNRPFEGLMPVEVAPPEVAPPEAPPADVAPLVLGTPAPRRPPAPAEPPGAVDILLDLIVNEPQEAAAPEPLDARPAAVSPAESTFAEDLAPTSAAFSTPLTEPATPDEAPDETDPLDPVDDGFAVPFGADGQSLRDLLPPTATDWHPAPLPDGDLLASSTPIASTATETAEALDPAPPVRPPEQPPMSDTHALLEPSDGWVDAPTGDAPTGDAPTGDAPTDNGRADSERAPAEPAPAEPAPTAPTPRPRSLLWPTLYILVVLMLSALVVWWAVAEQHPRIIRATPTAAPTAAPAAVVPAAPAAVVPAPGAPVLPADTLPSR